MYYMHCTSLRTHDSPGMHQSNVTTSLALMDIEGDPTRPAELIGDKVRSTTQSVARARAHLALIPVCGCVWALLCVASARLSLTPLPRTCTGISEHSKH